MTNIKTAFGRTPACPSLETLAQTPRSGVVERHLESCASCRAELALWQEFESAEPRPEERHDLEWIESELRRRSAPMLSPVLSPSIWDRVRALLAPQRQRAWAAVAATLLVFVAAGLYLQQGGDVRRTGAPDGTVWRSGRFAAISPVGTVAQPPSTVRWNALPGAISYQVELMEVDRTAIWAGETTQTVLDIPAEIQAQLRPGRAFQWQVTARNTAGEPIGATGLQRFDILLTTR